jgi:hypothetical protein
MDLQDAPQTEPRPTGIKNTKKNAASSHLARKKIEMLERSANEGAK